MKKILSAKVWLKRVLPLLLALLLCTGCEFPDIKKLWGGADDTTETPETNDDPAARQVRLLNDVSIEEYSIVYSASPTDYIYRAAKYIQSEIESRTGIKIPIKKDSKETGAHEIVVGETERQISKDLNAETKNVQFAILANETSIAMEGDYFIIAAAAYFFVETYVPGEYFDSAIPKETVIHEPIQKEAKNFILLIGDGMGFNQTLLFEKYDVATEGDLAFSDGEDIFYGYYLPYQGESRTKSASHDVTDSAAGGTALSTGYKTNNSCVGKDANGNEVQSLTELAGSLGKATAVFSTEPVTGATPAAFSAHANARTDTSVIKSRQTKLTRTYGTIITGELHQWDKFSKDNVKNLETEITTALDTLSKDKDGFFMMYEEAFIDQYCHSNKMQLTFNTVVQFNQAIGLFMEFAFYNPDTFVLITADHETGGLTKTSSGDFKYTSGNHTGANVPVFAYGYNANVFNNKTMENVQIPITIAAMMGQDDFGSPDYESLLKN